MQVVHNQGERQRLRNVFAEEEKKKNFERSPHPFLEAVDQECDCWSQHLCDTAPEVAVLLAFGEADLGFLNVNQTWLEAEGNACASRRS